MERGRPDIPCLLLPQHAPQPLLQLVGGLVCEGDGQDLPWAGRLHSTEVLHQWALLLSFRCGSCDVLLQECHGVLVHRYRDILTVAAPPVAQQVGHAVDKHRSLTGAGAGQQQQWSLRCQHALLLAGVQLLKISGDGSAPRRYESSFQVRHVAASLFSFLLLILIHAATPVNCLRKLCRIFVRFCLTRTIVRFIMRNRT